MFFFNQEKIKKFSFILFLIIFIIGFLSFKDFGVYNDEAFYRWIGFNYYNHFKEIILNFNFENNYILEINRFAENKNLKVWVTLPIFFELLTEFVADILNFKDTKNIFELRHFFNFIFFYISLIFFFKIVLHRFKNIFLAYISVLFLFFSPRIFAESFYNSKDLLFLSLSIINVYFSIKFINQKGLKIVLIYSIITGMLISTRIMGLISPMLLFGIIIFQFSDNTRILILKLKKILLSLILIIVTVYLFWPFLWSDPINNFIAYLRFVKSLDTYTNLYFGEVLLSNMTPWHFKYVWILITIPLSILSLAIFGLCFNLINFLRRLLLIEKNNKVWFNHSERLDFFILILLISPLILSLVQKNNYDGWRHIYYIYPFLVYHSIFIIYKMKNLNRNIFNIFIFVSLINIIISINWIIKYHPFQYAYFNSIQKIINKKFNSDYMGLSLKNSIEYILTNDQRKKINVSALGEVWLEGSISYLNKNLRERLIISTIEDSDYIIDTLRPRITKTKINPIQFKMFYTFIADGNDICVIYKKIN